MNGYQAIESAYVARLLAAFPDELDASRVIPGDPDAVYEAIFSSNEDYGVILEFGGGRRERREPFKGDVWTWFIPSIFVIRYGDGIEEKLRNIVSRITTLFSDDHTLGGVTPKAEISDIQGAEPVTVDDMPFYWLVFMFEALDK